MHEQFSGKDGMRFQGASRKYIALAALALLVGLAWFTLGPGKIRDVVCLILGFFAFRILLTQERKPDAPDEVL